MHYKRTELGLFNSLSISIACTLFPSVVIPAQDAASPSKLDRIIEDLHARDESIRSIFVRFTVESSSTGIPNAVHSHSVGWWGRAEQDVGQFLVPTEEAKKSEARQEFISQDSVHTLLAMNSAIPHLIIGSSQNPVMASRMPTWFGLWTRGMSVSKALDPKRGVRIELLGTEQRLGVECAKILLDESPARSTTELGFPFVLWIDDKDSHLVIETAAVFNGSAHNGPLGSTDIHGKDFGIGARFEVLKSTKVAGKWAIPVDCVQEFASGQGSNATTTRTELRVDIDSVRINDPAIKDLVAIPHDRWYAVEDTRSGAKKRTWFEGPFGEVTDETGRFYVQLLTECHRREKLAPLVNERDLKLSESTNAENVLLFTARAVGSSVSFAEIRESLHSQTSAGELSLIEFQRAAERLGMNGTVRKPTASELTTTLRAPNYFLVSGVRSASSPAASKHVALLAIEKDSVTLYSPLSEPEELSIAEFLSRWPGDVVIFEASSRDVGHK